MFTIAAGGGKTCRTLSTWTRWTWRKAAPACSASAAPWKYCRTTCGPGGRSIPAGKATATTGTWPTRTRSAVRRGLTRWATGRAITALFAATQVATASGANSPPHGLTSSLSAVKTQRTGVSWHDHHQDHQATGQDRTDGNRADVG